MCSDRELLYEEAPEAYKEIEDIVSDLEACGVINSIAGERTHPHAITPSWTAQLTGAATQFSDRC